MPSTNAAAAVNSSYVSECAMLCIQSCIAAEDWVAQIQLQIEASG
jgi:hypothetical protein